MSTKPDNDNEARAERPRVLLVDDYPDAREMYTEYLEFSGFDVVEAENGIEALQRAVDAAPDIILMDLSLPVMDGWEATRRLKADKRTASIPVVALTGNQPVVVWSERSTSLGLTIAFGPSSSRSIAVRRRLRSSRPVAARR